MTKVFPRREVRPPRRSGFDETLPSTRVLSLLGVLGLVVLGIGDELLGSGEGAPPSDRELQDALDDEGPAIRNVRATPPVAFPDEVISLGATITDPSGVMAAWILIETPAVGLNITLVRFGDEWFLNRSWETPGAYRFQIWAEDGLGNLSMASGDFQVQASLMNTFAAILLIGSLLVAGGALFTFLWLRRRPT